MENSRIFYFFLSLHRKSSNIPFEGAFAKSLIGSLLLSVKSTKSQLFLVQRFSEKVSELFCRHLEPKKISSIWKRFRMLGLQ